MRVGRPSSPPYVPDHPGSVVVAQRIIRGSASRLMSHPGYVRCLRIGPQKIRLRLAAVDAADIVHCPVPSLARLSGQRLDLSRGTANRQTARPSGHRSVCEAGPLDCAQESCHHMIPADDVAKLLSPTIEVRPETPSIAVHLQSPPT